MDCALPWWATGGYGYKAQLRQFNTFMLVSHLFVLFYWLVNFIYFNGTYSLLFRIEYNKILFSNKYSFYIYVFTLLHIFLSKFCFKFVPWWVFIVSLSFSQTVVSVLKAERMVVDVKASANLGIPVGIMLFYNYKLSNKWQIPLL